MLEWRVNKMMHDIFNLTNFTKTMHMSIIKLPMLFEGSKGEKTLYALFDSWATFSCIHPDYVDDIEQPNILCRPFN